MNKILMKPQINTDDSIAVILRACPEWNEGAKPEESQNRDSSLRSEWHFRVYLRPPAIAFI